MAKTQPPKKSSAGSPVTIDALAGMMKTSFEHLEGRLDRVEKNLDAMRVEAKEIEQRLTDRLDKIEFRLTGQDQRISILEDKLRQLATKVGMEFSR